MDFTEIIEFDNFDVFNEDYTCKSCNRSCINKDDVYYTDHYTDNTGYDSEFCKKCYNNKKHLNFYELKLLDRTNESNKPRLWNCYYCKTELGGGLKWYILKVKNDNGVLYDFCLNCCPDLQSFDFLNKVTQNHRRTYNYLIDASPIEYNYNEMFNNLPKKIKKLIPNNFISETLTIYENISEMDEPDRDLQLGKIKEWIMLLPFYHMNESIVECDTCMMINVRTTEVISCLWNVANCIILNKAYPNSDVFLNAFKKWQNEIKQPDKQLLIKKAKKDNQCDKLRYWNKNDLKWVLDFSAYFRYENNLNME